MGQSEKGAADQRSYELAPNLQVGVSPYQKFTTLYRNSSMSTTSLSRA